MATIGRAVFIVFLGLILGLVHSYCAPLKLQPDNNPAPPAEATQPGQPKAPGEALPNPPADEQPPAPPGESPAPPIDRPDPPPGVPAETEPNYYITVEKAKEYFDKGLAQNVIFVDARPAQDYTAGHIPGAMHLPPFEGVPAKATENLPGMTVVVYCHGATCTDSKAVMIGLQNLKRDIGPIYIMKDGIDAWRTKYPALIEAGPDPLGR